MADPTYQNPTFGIIKTKTAATVTEVDLLATVESDGTIAKIDPVNLPISTATQTALNLKANLSNPTFSGALSLSNNAVGSTANYLGQTIGGTDSWRIYGKSDVLDKSEMVFELADNGGAFDAGGEKFSFKYNCIIPADSRTAFEIDYKTFMFNTGAGLTTDPSVQLDGTLRFSNISSGMAPTLSGKSNTAQGLTVQAATFDAASLDMLFDVRTGANTDFTTLTNTAYRFRRFGTTLLNILRNGVVQMPNLSGTGTRQVVADASGNLSATDIAPISGTYTPTLTGTNNVSTVTIQGVPTYSRIGNIVTVSIGVNVAPTAGSGLTSFTATLPVNRSVTTPYNIGNANFYNGSSAIVAGYLQTLATTTVTCVFFPLSVASVSGTLTFQYSL